MIAKYFNVSPIEIMDGDYHYYMHQYMLATEDEVEQIDDSNNHQPQHKKTRKVESLFEAFGVTDAE